LPTAIAIGRSEASKVSYGTMLGCRLPARVAATPPATHAEAWLSSEASAASMSETSTWRPWPVRARSSSAAWIPLAAISPQIRSTTAAPTFSGGPSGSPVTCISPPIACSRKS
jgi:hypothetical protein